MKNTGTNGILRILENFYKLRLREWQIYIFSYISQMTF